MAYNRKENPPSAGMPWMNTFADLMNLLLCFFVLLFASSNVDEAKYEQLVNSFSSTFAIFNTSDQNTGTGETMSNGAAQLGNLDEYYSYMENANNTNDSQSSDLLKAYQEKQKADTEKKYNQLSDLVQEKGIDGYVDIGMDDKFQFVKISLNGAILFDSGQSDIKKDAIPILSKVGEVLKRFDTYHIVIEGHTDNVPISNANFKNNLWLSTARAATVYEYFINQKGLNPVNLESSGRSEYDPIASNETADGRAKNRRVEIKIYND